MMIINCCDKKQNKERRSSDSVFGNNRVSSPQAQVMEDQTVRSNSSLKAKVDVDSSSSESASTSSPEPDAKGKQGKLSKDDMATSKSTINTGATSTSDSSRTVSSERKCERINEIDETIPSGIDIQINLSPPTKHSKSSRSSTPSTAPSSTRLSTRSDKTSMRLLSDSSGSSGSSGSGSGDSSANADDSANANDSALSYSSPSSSFQSSIRVTASTAKNKQQRKQKQSAKNVTEQQFKDEPKEEGRGDETKKGYHLVNSLIKAVSKRRLHSLRSLSTYNNIHESVTTGVLNGNNSSKKHDSDRAHKNNNYSNDHSICSAPARFFNRNQSSLRDSTCKWGSAVSIQGVVGLANLGNSCFMNSALQCLSNTIPLTNYFLGYQYRREINRTNFLGTKGVLVEAYASLMKEMWLGKDRVVKPVNFKSQLQSFAPQFLGTRQQDAQEVLSYLLDGIHEDLNRVKNKPYIEDVEGDGQNDESDSIQAWHNYLLRDKSVIVDIFQGQLRNTLTCTKCSHCSVKFDPFMYLSVPITEDVGQTAATPKQKLLSLDDCLEIFCREELLTNENQWYCPKCEEHVDAKKKFDLWTLPPILIVHLKRFKHHQVHQFHNNNSYTRTTRGHYGHQTRSRVTKLNKKIDFPFKNWKPSLKRNGNDPSYDLYAVSNHFGGYGRGHYTSFAMNRIDDEWYEFNDSLTKKVDESHIQRNNDAAYVLFYNQTENSNNEVQRRVQRIRNETRKKKTRVKTNSMSSVDHGSEKSICSTTKECWSKRVPIVYKQSISRPENWPHLQNDASKEEERDNKNDSDDDSNDDTFRDFRRQASGQIIPRVDSTGSNTLLTPENPPGRPQSSYF